VSISFVKGFEVSNTGKLFVIAIISLSFFLNSANAMSLPKAAKLVAPETVLLVEVKSFDELRGQFEKTVFYKLYKDPSVQPFIEDFKTKVREKIKQSQNELASAVVKAEIFPKKKFALGIVLQESILDMNELPVILLSQWGDDTAKIKEAIESATKKAIEEGSFEKSQDYKGVTIKTITYKDSSKLSWCFIDDTLLAATEIELVKFSVAHIKGATSPTLADDEDYNSTLAAVGPYHDIDYYFNVKQIIKTLTVKDPDEKDAKEFISNLGLDNVASAGFSMGFARKPGHSFNAKAILKINGQKKGIFKMLEPDSAVLKTPSFIPASIYSATFINLDINKMYSELAKILNSFSPEYASILYMPLLPPEPDSDESGITLKNDIIAHLGSEIIVSQSLNKPFNDDANPSEYLFALGVNNSRALEKSLSLLHSKMLAVGDPDAKKELLGHTIYLVSMRGLPFFGQGMAPMQAGDEQGVSKMPKLAFTITNTHIIFSTEASVEKAIRTMENGSIASAASAKWFNKAKSNIPSVVGLASFEDDAASAEFLWWMLKKSGMSKTAGIPTGVAPMQLDPRQIDELANFSLLPDYETVKKYFGLSSSYGISRPDGFFFEFNGIDPASSD